MNEESAAVGRKNEECFQRFVAKWLGIQMKGETIQMRDYWRCGISKSFVRIKQESGKSLKGYAHICLLRISGFQSRHSNLKVQDIGASSPTHGVACLLQMQQGICVALWKAFEIFKVKNGPRFLIKKIVEAV